MTDSNIYEQVNSKLGFTRPETDHSHAMHLVSTSPASLAADHQHLDLGGEHIVLQSLKDLYLEQGDVREAAT